MRLHSLQPEEEATLPLPAGGSGPCIRDVPDLWKQAMLSHIPVEVTLPDLAFTSKTFAFFLF